MSDSSTENRAAQYHRRRSGYQAPLQWHTTGHAEQNQAALDEYRYQALHSLVIVPASCPVNLAEIAE